MNFYFKTQNVKLKTLSFILTFGVLTFAQVNATSLSIGEAPEQELKYSDEGGLQQDEMNPNMGEYPVYEEDFTEEEEVVESDSSYYSVNKFNILLYFVYKLKYGEEDAPVEE